MHSLLYQPPVRFTCGFCSVFMSSQHSIHSITIFIAHLKAPTRGSWYHEYYYGIMGGAWFGIDIYIFGLCWAMNLHHFSSTAPYVASPLYSVFPSWGNSWLQEWEPCQPIKLQKGLNYALWLAHMIETVAMSTGRIWKSVV